MNERTRNIKATTQSANTSHHKEKTFLNLKRAIKNIILFNSYNFKLKP